MFGLGRFPLLCSPNEPGTEKHNILKTRNRRDTADITVMAAWRLITTIL